MRRASVLWEVYVTRFEDALGRYRKRRLTGEEEGGDEEKAHRDSP